MIHEVTAPEDGGADVSDLLASSLERAGNEVLVSGLDVIVDGYAVEKHVLGRVDEELLGVEEGISHVLKLSHIIGTDLITVLQGSGDLGYELAELVDASGNLMEGAILEVIHGDGDVGYEGINILDASLEAVDVLSLESANEYTVDQLSHVKDRVAMKITQKWASKVNSGTSWITGQFRTAKFWSDWSVRIRYPSLNLMNCCSEVFHNK